MKDKIKVWAMIEGPIHKSDLPKEEQENYYGGDLEFFAVSKVEVNGRLEDHEFYLKHSIRHINGKDTLKKIWRL